ncbi:HTH-type transcriptional repressor fabR [Kluyvera cryocrescens]|uniref:HTH-type transcriptional repressor fabR n=1 Tax=Kluyvera cryocrescens TaxID=580 RepID=A0A485BHK2_KLUCR|nr:HTH-type transcriptional repressor fabR [Kluyvera cryocrescens]
MMGVRAQQKEKTRRSLVEAAFSQLSAERSFASLSLREVAREAGHCANVLLSPFP